MVPTNPEPFAQGPIIQEKEAHDEAKTDAETAKFRRLQFLEFLQQFQLGHFIRTLFRILEPKTEFEKKGIYLFGFGIGKTQKGVSYKSEIKTSNTHWLTVIKGNLQWNEERGGAFVLGGEKENGEKKGQN